MSNNQHLKSKVDLNEDEKRRSVGKIFTNELNGLLGRPP
jgi:hypothetical protein